MGSNVKMCFGLLVALFCLRVVAHCQTHANWETQVVDKVQPGEADSFISFAIDRFGNSHLVYSNRSGTTLHYSYREKTAARWDKTIVGSEGGTYESLAVDSHGFAHIAYNSPKLSGLHYASWDGKEWQSSLVDTERSSHQTSIVLDSHDQPRISYYREEFPDRRYARYLKYAYFDGKNWLLQTVDHRAGSGRWNDIVLDSKERSCISYSVATTGSTGLACLEGTDWERELSDARSAKGRKSGDYANSLAFGSDDQPRVAYLSASDREVNYSWKEGGSWRQETVDSIVSSGAESERICLKLDKSGQPHIIYFDSGLGALKYAVRGKDGWHTEIIDGGNAGEYASLSLDANDLPYVAYYAPADRELRIAHRAATPAKKP